MENYSYSKEIGIQEEKLRLMEIEYEHIRKQNAKLKHEKTEAFDSHTLFPHVFQHASMPMYVFKS